MNVYEILQTVPVVAAVFSMQVGVDKTAAKIEELSNLKAGWHYGSGQPITSEVLRRLAQLSSQARRLAITQTDVFPGVDGDATLALYRGEEDFYFRVHADGDIEFGSEWGDFGEPIPLTWQDALNCLYALAARDTWKSFSFSTSGTTTLREVALGVVPSTIRVIEVASRFLTMTVPSPNRGAFAHTPANTTRESPTSLQSIGSLIPPSSRLVTS